MKITNDARSIVAQALRDKKMSQAALAKKLDVGRSWVTKFFNGSLKSLSDDHFFALQETLGVRLVTVSGDQNPLASKLASQIQKDPKVGQAFSEILAVMTDDHYYDLPMLPTKDLVDFGKEILRASHEDPGKPGKVGKIALTWLADRLQTLKQ